MASAQSLQPVTVCRGRVAQIKQLPHCPDCLLINGSKVTLSSLLAAHIAPADDISFPLTVTAATEIYVTKNSLTGSRRDVYQASIRYVSQPKKDKRDQFFVSAEVHPANLGISSIFIPCEVLREYFYRIPRTDASSDHPTLYDVLHIPSTASLAELRVSFKLRQLELHAARASRSEHVLIERAFNIVGNPELRAC